MAQLRLKDLLAGIHAAVATAQAEVERQHVRNLSQFFEEDGTPVYIDVKLPNMAPGSAGEEVLHRIPLLSLMPISAIQIRDLSVDLRVNLSDLAKAEKKGALGATDKGDDGLFAANLAARKALGDESQQPAGLSADFNPGFFTRKDNTARLKITFESGEPAEGFLKLNDLLMKLF